MSPLPRRSVDDVCRRRQTRVADAGGGRTLLLLLRCAVAGRVMEDALRDDLTRYFGWAPPVQKLIAVLDPQTTNRIEIHDIEPFDKWVRWCQSCWMPAQQYAG